MKWSFPSDTTVIPLNRFTYTNPSTLQTDYGYRKLVIYAPDVYGTV